MACSLLYRDLGESKEVLTPLWEDASEARSESPESAASKTRRPDTCSDLASRRCSSETKKTLKCSWWTTAPMPPKLPTASPLRPGKSFHSPYYLYGHLWLRFVIVWSFRKAIVARAKELNVRLTNAQGKLKKVSAEWAGWQYPHTSGRPDKLFVGSITFVFTKWQLGFLTPLFSFSLSMCLSLFIITNFCAWDPSFRETHSIDTLFRPLVRQISN